MQSLVDAAAALRDGTLRSQDVTQACLRRAANLNPRLNAFLEIDAEKAMAAARAADGEWCERGPLGLLHGVPLAHKDMFYRTGATSTCGSQIRRNWSATTTAETLQRLDAAGALTLGRLGMSEFALGPIGLNAHYGAVRNPWNADYVSGGSSSGSASAVSAGLAFGALGSDTGASIRVPSSACGIVGMKPTAGLLSRAGTMPLSYTLDVVGPLTRTVADAALLMAILTPPADAELNCPARVDFLKISEAGGDTPRIKIGIPRKFFVGSLHADVAQVFEECIRKFSLPAVAFVDIDDGIFAEAGGLYGEILGYEAYALHERYVAESHAEYSPNVLNRLQQAKAVTSASYINSMRRRAELITACHARVFSAVDIVMAPILENLLPTVQAAEAATGRPMQEMVHSFLRLTSPINVLGLPALALPAGITPDGLPCGLQLIGPQWSDALLLVAGQMFEAVSDMGGRAPDLI